MVKQRECEQLRTEQVIDESQPGTVVRDFETLLDFLKDGVRTTGKYHLIPMSQLFDLDERMSKPLRPNNQRPQQKSFPHINALYMLLRATELGVPRGQGKRTGRLELDESVLAQWRKLNNTEKYFTLLEAWLRRCVWEVAGLSSRSGGDFVYFDAFGLWASGCNATRNETAKLAWLEYLTRGVKHLCNLAFFELFGMMEVFGEKPNDSQTWSFNDACLTRWGTEILPILFDDKRFEPMSGSQLHFEFGAWQQFFQPSFPQWVNNLELPEFSFREGAHFFKVSLGEPWRRIAIPATADLDELAWAIIKSFDFDGDHLYAFCLKSPDGRTIFVEHPMCDGEIFTDAMAVGALPLGIRQQMEFLYDFGAGWWFDVTLERVEPEAKDITKAIVVETKGKAPPEYEFDDEDDYEFGDEDE